ALTLLPLIRRIMMVVLVTLAAMVTLSEMGVDIAPLLAGAGVLGLAVGFGSQTLVKDVVTGLFILLEDQISVGDVAELGGHTGVIEAISIRTVRLRDLQGIVHIVPFGEVTTVKNYTREYAYAFMEVGVAYRENTDHVIEVLKEVAEDLRQDPEHGPNILEPLEVMGVDRFDDSAVIIRVRFKAVAMTQWGIRREYNRRMKLRFDRDGIEIPFPHQTLYFGEDRAGRAPPARVRVDTGDGERLAGATGPEADNQSGTGSGGERGKGVTEPPAG
ncbi:MAG: mechanosensitive ion channel, partial [Alphaproteobacteria bacterium]